ncbi:DUF485 domain-containing protein [Actinoallomurus bryophytorum]|nr:DUF485 domain-containing protein [Actinoallomurus bryophytorum]
MAGWKTREVLPGRKGCLVVIGSPPSPRRSADSPDHARYVAISQDERFIVLRRKTGRVASLVTALLVAWYLLYVIAAAFARDLMRYRLAGNVNVALVFGVLQFASTFFLAWRYSRYSRRVLDPLRARVAADSEEER